MITIDFDSELNRVSFNSDSVSRDLFILNRIGSILDATNQHYDYFETRIGRFSISAVLFLEFHDMLLDCLASNEQQLTLTNTFCEFLDWAYQMLNSVDTAEPLTEEQINERLGAVGWNMEHRRPSIFQVRNLVELSNHHNGAIFSVPGAGKTVESLAYASLLTGEHPSGILVVAPRNAYIAWETEAEACLGLDVANQVYRAIGTNEELEARLFTEEPPRIVLVNYNRLMSRHSIFTRYLRHLGEQDRRRILIFDESHHFKGGRAFTSAVKQISPLADHRIILSGTPMPRSVEDLVPQFQALLPMHIQEINEHTVEGFSDQRFVRTTKQDLRLRMPIIRFCNVEMGGLQREIYNMLSDFTSAEIAARGSRRSTEHFIRMQRIIMFLVMQASNPRLLDERILSAIENSNEGLAEQIREARDRLNPNGGQYGPKIAWACNRARELALRGQKVVIWSTFVDNIQWISDELEDLNAVYICGEVPTMENNETFTRDDADPDEELYREGRINRFKNDPECMVLVANPAAAGEGISLHTVCHHAIYIDRSFNATEFMQSMDRIHRYGLDRERNVICGIDEGGVDTTIEIIQCTNSVDDLLVQPNLARKQQAMYEWLNDPSLNPALGRLNPPFTAIELDNLLNYNG
jgi:SNF2 family DNA or RNA helicase